jgi:NADPH:quinone reductase-like Zn-dependent oxidoreductase
MAQAQAEVFRLYRAGHLHPLVGDLLPLTEALDALERVTSGRTTGKVLLAAAA